MRAHDPPVDPSPSSDGESGDFDVDAAFLRFERVLRKVARRRLGPSSARSTQTTALLNEAWLKLDSKRTAIVDEEHLFALAVRVLGHLAVDRHRAAARRRNHLDEYARDPRRKSNGLGEDTVSTKVESILEDVAAHSLRAAAVAKLKLFESLTLEQISEVLGVSERTVSYDWRFARAMLESGLRGR